MLPTPIGPLHSGWHICMALHLEVGSRFLTIMSVDWAAMDTKLVAVN